MIESSTTIKGSQHRQARTGVCDIETNTTQRKGPKRTLLMPILNEANAVLELIWKAYFRASAPTLLMTLFATINM